MSAPPTEGGSSNADHLLFADVLAQPARDVNGLGERRAEGDLRRFAVGHHEAQRDAPRGAHEGAIEGLHAALAPRKASACSSCTAARTSIARGRRRHGRAEADRDGIGNPARHLPQKTSALEAEDAAPHAVEVHGNDGDIDALHDALEAAAEGKQSGRCA